VQAVGCLLLSISSIAFVIILAASNLQILNITMSYMEYRDYMKRIQDKIGEAQAADRIEEGSWLNIVVKELNNVSNDCAKRLEKEIGCKWDKGSYILGLNEAPPTRLLGLQIALASWIGRIMHQKHGKNNQVLSSDDCWNRIDEAYEHGVNLSINKETP
jgi:hypothetical protein